MPKIARLYDSISHGGQIIDGSPDSICNSREIARIGDPVMCAVHGLQHISSGSESVTYVNGIPMARVGDSISCGAVITSGSGDCYETN